MTVVAFAHCSRIIPRRVFCGAQEEHIGNHRGLKLGLKGSGHIIRG